jgi:hypothetical protein
MAISDGTRHVSNGGPQGSRRGALKAALIIGSIIALFLLLSLARPMPEENVLTDSGGPPPTASQQSPVESAPAP